MDIIFFINIQRKKMSSKKELRKKEIALKAYESLVIEGVDKFSLNGLLEKISMSKGNFYHYFSNKDELFCFTINQKYEEIYTKYLEKNNNTTFDEKLNGIFFIYLSDKQEIKEYMSIINQMYYMFSNEKNTHLYSYMQATYVHQFSTLEAIINSEIQKGLLKEDIKVMIKPIFATADGMLTHSFMLKDYDLNKELSKYLEFIVNTYKI